MLLGVADLVGGDGHGGDGRLVGDAGRQPQRAVTRIEVVGQVAGHDLDLGDGVGSRLVAERGVVTQIGGDLRAGQTEPVGDPAPLAVRGLDVQLRPARDEQGHDEEGDVQRIEEHLDLQPWAHPSYVAATDRLSAA